MDIKNDIYWNNLTPEIFKEDLSHIRVSNNRIRFMSRGEAFVTPEDVIKVKSLMVAVPEYLFWIPTRAWRSNEMRLLIEQQLLILSNNRIIASTDPSNTRKEIESLKNNNWSTMFFGNNSDIEGRIKCPKTWLKKRFINKAYRLCRTCNLCFSDKRIDIHLKKH